MSIRGTIFPCELAKNYDETIHHLSELAAPNHKDELAAALSKKIDLVKEYFLVVGGFTHASSRTLIYMKRLEKQCWRSLPFRHFISNKMPLKAKLFVLGPNKREAWITSQYLPETKTWRDHHMPFFVEKTPTGIKVTTLDNLKNWNAIRETALKAFSNLGVPVEFYVTTEKRQHDWTNCPVLTLDDLHQLDKIDRSQFYSFIQKNSTSVEKDEQGRWTIYLSKHVPVNLYRMVQSMEDFNKYEAWVKENGAVDAKTFEEFKNSIMQRNQWVDGNVQQNQINNRLGNRYKNYARALINRILRDVPPVTEDMIPDPGLKLLRGRL